MSRSFSSPKFSFSSYLGDFWTCYLTPTISHTLLPQFLTRNHGFIYKTELLMYVADLKLLALVWLAMPHIFRKTVLKFVQACIDHPSWTISHGMICTLARACLPRSDRTRSLPAHPVSVGSSCAQSLPLPPCPCVCQSHAWSADGRWRLKGP